MASDRSSLRTYKCSIISHKTLYILHVTVLLTSLGLLLASTSYTNSNVEVSQMYSAIYISVLRYSSLCEMIYFWLFFFCESFLESVFRGWQWGHNFHFASISGGYYFPAVWCLNARDFSIDHNTNRPFPTDNSCQHPTLAYGDHNIDINDIIVKSQIPKLKKACYLSSI